MFDPLLASLKWQCGCWIYQTCKSPHPECMRVRFGICSSGSTCPYRYQHPYYPYRYQHLHLPVLATGRAGEQIACLKVEDRSMHHHPAAVSTCASPRLSLSRGLTTHVHVCAHTYIPCAVCAHACVWRNVRFTRPTHMQAGVLSRLAPVC